MKTAEKRKQLRLKTVERFIRRRVCSHCIDFGADGVCHTQDPEGCAIFRFLPKLQSIVRRVHSTQIASYGNVLRREVCQKCVHQRSDGKCDVRSGLDCGLDRYLVLVIDALDELNNKSHN